MQDALAGGTSSSERSIDRPYSTAMVLRRRRRGDGADSRTSAESQPRVQQPVVELRGIDEAEAADDEIARRRSASARRAALAIGRAARDAAAAGFGAIDRPTSPCHVVAMRSASSE